MAVNAKTVAEFISHELSGLPFEHGTDAFEERGEVVVGRDVVESVAFTTAYTSLMIGDKEFFVEVKQLS